MGEGTQHVIFNVGFAMQKLGFKILNMGVKDTPTPKERSKLSFKPLA